MRFKPQKYRSFLLRGTATLITTLSLLYVTGWHISESTGSDAIQPIATTSTTETESVTTSTISSTTTTVTTTTTVESMTESTTAIATTSIPIETETVQEYVTEAVASVEEQQAAASETSESDIPISQYEYDLLCKIVASEYGGMLDVYERAKIVASVMNQSIRLGKSIESCLYQTCVPWGFNINGEYFCGQYYTAMADAVDYYFANRDTVFAGWDADSWYGGGGYNHFYRQLY